VAVEVYAVTWDWLAVQAWNGVPIDTIERDYFSEPVPRHHCARDIVNVSDATRYNLRSAHEIATCSLPSAGSSVARRIAPKESRMD
jgi:hypothetical protein